MVLSAAAADAVIVHVAVWTPVLTNTPTREISTVRAQAAGALQGNSAFRVRWEDPAP